MLGAAPGSFPVALSPRISFACGPGVPAGNRPLVGAQGGRGLEEPQETEEISKRVAALDVGKAELTCWVRVPSPGKRGRRAQEVRSYQTMTRWLLALADRLAELGVTRVVMEAPATCWKGASATCWKPTALRPGWSMPVTSTTSRAAQDRHLDAVWLGKLAERRCCGPGSCHHRRSASCGT